MSDQPNITGKRFLLALLLLAGCATQPVAPNNSAAAPVPVEAEACVASLAGHAPVHGRPLDAAAILEEARGDPPSDKEIATSARRGYIAATTANM